MKSLEASCYKPFLTRTLHLNFYARQNCASEPFLRQIAIRRSFANLLPWIGAQNAIPRWIIWDMASIKTPRIGALTAEAVMRDYEFTAKAIEVLGAELIIALKRFEAMTTEGNDGAQKPFASKPGLSQ